MDAYVGLFLSLPLEVSTVDLSLAGTGEMLVFGRGGDCLLEFVWAESVCLKCFCLRCMWLAVSLVLSPALSFSLFVSFSLSLSLSFYFSRSLSFSFSLFLSFSLSLLVVGVTRDAFLFGAERLHLAPKQTYRLTDKIQRERKIQREYRSEEHTSELQSR